MPTTRSQRLADPDNSTASDSGSDLQPSSSEHGLTIDRFRRALSSTYLAGGAAPEVQLYYRKFESDETCDDLHCGATNPSYLYPQLLLETVCPHIDITPSERSKTFGPLEVWWEPRPSVPEACIRLFGSSPDVLLIVLNYLWQLFARKPIRLEAPELLPKKRNVKDYNSCYELLRISQILRLPRELIEDHADKVMDEIDQDERNWKGLVKLLYSVEHGLPLPKWPNVSIKTHAGMKFRLAGAIAFAIICDTVKNVDALWALEMQFPDFHDDLSDALRDQWRWYQEYTPQEADVDDDDYCESSEGDDWEASEEDDCSSLAEDFNEDVMDDGPTSTTDIMTPPIFASSARWASQPPICFREPPWWARRLLQRRTGFRRLSAQDGAA